MTQQKERPTVDGGGEPPDTIERLLRLAGSRPEAGPERVRRVRQSVDAVWRDSIRQRTRRRRQILATLVALAAAVVVIAAALRRTESSPPPARPALAARLTATTGIIRRLDD